ncbi:MAG TPA: biosynthetic-type acetolactate synthase large subunit [bacterium]|nr:biosynthetic-type acetolactate synthase large subunit [bacterium]
MLKSGAEIFVECLKRLGVEVIFGHPGGVVLGIYDQLYDADITHVFCRHEQVAVHAADGYARASGKPGVVLVTSGPGATNTVTGVANAFMDSIPIVVFTGQVLTALVGNDAFQEADIVGITRPCTKHNVLVKDVKDLARTIYEAFFIATTGCPGPVLVDLPKDVVQFTKIEPEYPVRVELRGYRPIVECDLAAVKEGIDLIRESERPVIYTGGGILSADADRELFEFATSLGIPVTTTLLGLGGFPETHPLSLGMLGMHGTYFANMAMNEADLIIAVGARFDDRITGKLDEFAPYAKILHIDISPANINKSVWADVSVVGDARVALRHFNALLKDVDLTERKKAWATWLETVARWKREKPLSYTPSDSAIMPQYLVEQIREATRGEAIVVTGVGQHQMWAAQYYRFTKPRTMITSGGLGTMGFGFPAAIGVQMARPDSLVVVIDGDGSFEMTHQDVVTAVNYKLPIKVAIVNNGYLGMVRQWQELFFNRRYSSVDLRPQTDFVKLAEAYGATGLRATTPEEVRPTLEKALSIDGPVIMDFQVAREANVFPMIPAGAAAKDMLLA